MAKHNEINPVQSWVENDKKLAAVLVEIQSLNVSIKEQVEIAFNKIPDLYGLAKMPEDVQYDESDEGNLDEDYVRTSVYEQFGLLKYVNEEDDLRGILLSSVYFVKNGYATDIEEVYKKYFSKNSLPIAGIGFKGTNSNVELVFVKKGESWHDMGCKLFIKYE